MSPVDKTCPRCGTRFRCGHDDSGACWCDRYPPVLVPAEGSSCFCESCLALELQPHVERYVASIPAGLRPLGDAMRYHKPGVFIEHLDYYVENGRLVFTEWFHLKRGQCCGNGCRHCPYGKSTHVN